MIHSVLLFTHTQIMKNGQLWWRSAFLRLSRSKNQAGRVCKQRSIFQQGEGEGGGGLRFDSVSILATIVLSSVCGYQSHCSGVHRTPSGHNGHTSPQQTTRGYSKRVLLKWTEHTHTVSSSHSHLKMLGDLRLNHHLGHLAWLGD